MSSVGETLRAERLSKKFSLDQIARETKINSHLLDAIEKNQFDLLPRGVFAKSFVRQYARILGLDEEEMAAEVQKAMHSGMDVPSFAVRPADPAFKVPKVTQCVTFGTLKAGSAGLTAKLGTSIPECIAFCTSAAISSSSSPRIRAYCRTKLLANTPRGSRSN